MKKSDNIILAKSAIELTEQHIRQKAKSVMAARINQLVQKAASMGMYKAIVPVSKEELPFAMYITELLRQNGFTDVQFVKRSFGEWHGEISFSWQKGSS